MAEWSRVVNTTMHEFAKGAEDNVMRNRKYLAKIQAGGRVSFDHAGDLMDFKVEFKRPPVEGYADMDTLSFPRRDRIKTAQLPWRGYATTDSMTKKEKLMNKNTEAIVKSYSAIAPALVSAMTEAFGDEMYTDGEAAGNERRMHGLESFFGTTGTPATNGFIVPPSDTYATLSTALGNYGGAWSTSGGNDEWPTGRGDAHYDFWSPLIVDYTDTAWAATTKTWANTGKEALRYGIIKSQRNRSKAAMLDLIMLNDELYRLFLELLDDNERLVVNRNEKTGLWNLGFSDVVNFDGVDVTKEYGIDSTVGYGIATQQMELCSLQGQLFVPEGPDFDIATQSWRFSFDFFGNLKHNPRYFVKWDNVT
jgi:hypothetical protein